jgi:lipid-A-disaccharide synthase
MKYFIIAGEASGDLHGSHLVRALKKLDQNARFKGFGGDKLQAENMDILVHIRDIAFMGIKEVLANLKTIRRMMGLCRKEIIQFKPDALLLIDYPGFNLLMARFAKKKGIRVIYYISPQLWAWKEKRLKKIKKYVDRLICILPFEEDFYKERGYKAYYAGHPLADQIASFRAESNFCEKHKIVKEKSIAVLPGSRKQEIDKMLPVMAGIKKHFPDFEFLIAATSSFDASYYRKLLPPGDFKIIFDQSYQIMHYSRAGIISSGTATLEAALFKLPLLVCYKTTRLTYHIFKYFAKVRFISLINLILNKEVVKELIQDRCNEDELKKELERLLFDQDYIDAMQKEFDSLIKKLGGGNASENAALIIHDFLQA